jgi:scyllo-inositol 2-dehydrogenase (NADP+)
MRVVVIGYGVQGRKRARVAGGDLVATIDPQIAEASHRRLADIPADSYDAALVCTPDSAKPALLTELFSLGKHVLVEKPLLGSEAELQRLADLAAQHKVVGYTAYNHRFEPHWARLEKVLRAGGLGRVYHARLFYGNGTARLVRDSQWRDSGSGVIHDLGSHLLDICRFWFPEISGEVTLRAAHRFENRAPDHAIFTLKGPPYIELEMSLLSWRNDFSGDVFGERGSAHLRSLCKWGPTSITLRTRVLPSGKPLEESDTLTQEDPTWAAEYAHFKALCAAGGPSSFANDIWIGRALASLAEAAEAH